MIASHVCREMSPNELNDWLRQKKQFYLIDLLKSDTFTRRHIPDARNACVFEVTFIDQVKAITDDSNAEIVLYGASARSMDAAVAAEKLHHNGYRHLFVVKGGMEAWQAAGLSLEGDAADEPHDPQTILKLDDGSYGVDSEKSVIQWWGRNPSTTHFGTVRVSGGILDAKGGTITGRVDIDMDSIANINLEGDELQPILVAHLKSDDFFLTKRFPTASYRIDRAVTAQTPYLSLPNYEINGTLELKGIEVSQDFAATITTTPEKELLAEAHFDIDRTKWGVIYGSARFFEFLGMHMVFDLISFHVRIVAA